MSPPAPAPKPQKNKDLLQDKASAYKPAYKKVPKTTEDGDALLPFDIAEIVAVWPELPEYIKAAIKALIQTHKTENK